MSTLHITFFLPFTLYNVQEYITFSAFTLN